jgi:death-on-curing protein
LYLDREDYERIHARLAAQAEGTGEPIPSFDLAKQADLEALINTPRRSFFGHTAYPAIEDKAAIIFYTINKLQIFLNGNKRMSTLALLVFLDINGRQLDVAPDELTAKALWLAKTASLDFPEVKDELTGWIREHLTSQSA